MAACSNRVADQTQTRSRYPRFFLASCSGRSALSLRRPRGQRRGGQPGGRPALGLGLGSDGAEPGLVVRTRADVRPSSGACQARARFELADRDRMDVALCSPRAFCAAVGIHRADSWVGPEASHPGVRSVVLGEADDRPLLGPGAGPPSVGAPDPERARRGTDDELATRPERGRERGMVRQDKESPHV